MYILSLSQVSIGVSILSGSSCHLNRELVGLTRPSQSSKTLTHTQPPIHTHTHTYNIMLIHTYIQSYNSESTIPDNRGSLSKCKQVRSESRRGKEKGSNPDVNTQENWEKEKLTQQNQLLLLPVKT